MKNKNNNILFISIIIIFIILISIIIIYNITQPKEGTLTSLTYEEITEKINNEESFILIVSQSTCSHCASYKPKLKTIAKNYSIDIYYIDYDLESDDNAEEFLDTFSLDGSTPITLFFKDGKETSILDRIEGEISQKKAIEKFKKMGFIE